jgi:cell division protein FtsW
LGVVLLLAAYALLTLTLLMGNEVKGARRWINLAGFSLQASELLKPALIVASAWMFAEWRKNPAFKGHIFAVVLYALACGLLLMQPDVGMTILISVIWWAQFFLAGLPMMAVLVVAVLAMLAAVGGYAMFPHVRSRVDRFLDPTTGDTYQVDQSLRAIQQGGWFGVGPGEGRVKNHLPDAHADFIFSVAGEEFGIIACILVVLLFAAITLRGMRHVWHESNPFVALAVQGLLLQFFLQAFINIASSLNLIPTKGMTLPFVSYGGSSLLGIAIGMGMVLALTRRRASVRVRV